MSEIITPRLPSGFNELLPDDQRVFDVLIEKITREYESFGYSHLETTALELTEILQAKGGDSTDKEMYSFTKGTTDLSLHYDLTVPLARFIAEHESQLTFPFKRYQIQKVWRAEKPQKGRYREFYQCDIDVIGKPTVGMDAEVVAVTINALNSAGVFPVVVHIAHRKVLQEMILGIGVTQDFSAIIKCVDKLEKIGVAGVEKMLSEISLNSDQIRRVIEFASHKGTGTEVIAALADYKISPPVLDELCEISDLLSSYGVLDQVVFDMSITRGLEYYTGFVFETNIVGHEDVGSIASGGRYDNLCGYYSKSAYAGTGFSIGLSRLFSVCSDQIKSKLLPESSLVVVVALADTFYQEALKVAQTLREKGMVVEVLHDIKSMRDQLSYANAKGASRVVIIGEDEVAVNKVTLKDMKTGAQEMVEVINV